MKESLTGTARLALALLLFSGAVAHATKAPSSSFDFACQESLTRPILDPNACLAALSASDADGTMANTVRRGRLFSLLGILHARLENLQRAREYMDDAVALAGDDYVVSSNTGILLLREQDFTGAVERFNSAINSIPEGNNAHLTKAPIHFNRALAMSALGEYEAARIDYQRYRQLTRPAETLDGPWPPESVAPKATTSPLVPPVTLDSPVE